MLPQEYQLTTNGDQFLVFDSGIGDLAGIFIFASDRGLQFLYECDHWTHIHKEVRHMSLKFFVAGGGYGNKKLLVPPTLSHIKEFKDRLHETKIWHCLTDLEKEKQGPAI